MLLHAIDRHPLFTYDPTANELAIVFTTGHCYTYHDVPLTIASGMRSAFSKGEYFNANIRDHFRFTRQRRAAA